MTGQDKERAPLRARSILHEVNLGDTWRGPRERPSWSDASLPVVKAPAGLLGTRAAGRLRVANYTEEPTRG